MTSNVVPLSYPKLLTGVELRKWLQAAALAFVRTLRWTPSRERVRQLIVRAEREAA